MGYWSEDCEHWFQQHLDKCKSGKASLKNPGSWRHSIRFSKLVNDITEKNDHLATKFLEILPTNF